MGPSNCQVMYVESNVQCGLYYIGNMFKDHIYFRAVSLPVEYSIVLCKMFSRWFVANKKIIMTIRTLKFGDVTYNVMS